MSECAREERRQCPSEQTRSLSLSRHQQLRMTGAASILLPDHTGGSSDKREEKERASVHDDTGCPSDARFAGESEREGKQCDAVAGKLRKTHPATSERDASNDPLL